MTDTKTAVASPGDVVQPLSDRELGVLREVGEHWQEVVGPHLGRLRELPVDPALRFREEGSRRGRFRVFRMFRPEGPDELEATEQATAPVTGVGRVVEAVQRAVIGPPLRSSAVVHEKMRKLVALPVLSSDLLSSVAYGPEAMLSVLVLTGRNGLRLSLPLSAVLVALMLAVGASYRQTLAAYPTGAGSYIVAGDNLGELAGVVAAVGLLVDYILTVAVSVAAGLAAVTSALPGLSGWVVALGVATITLLLAGNLRGVREGGYLFAAPTYVFLLAMAALIGTGLWQAAGRGFATTPPPPVHAVEGLTLLVVLRAFSSGATSMTGMEATANAVPAFEPPEWKNARTALTWMVAILITMFVGLVVLIHLDGLVPGHGQTLLSQLAERTFGRGALYGLVQASTALILLFAANTSFNGFPRLLYFMARGGHAPRSFLRMGDRLAFSNGIVVLAILAIAIFVGFHGNTIALIPLYAVGVFLAITLSQAGMVIRWLRTRERSWRRGLAINAVGAILAAIVLVVAATTKFKQGAWVVVIAIPLLVWLCLRVRAHYDDVGRAVALVPPPPGARHKRRGRHSASRTAVVPAAREERQESPEQLQHLLLVPIERLDLVNLRALAYAASLDQPLLAVHISVDEDEADRFHREWGTFGVPLRLEVLLSPYRALVPPLAHYIEALQAQRAGLTTTVVLPEIVVEHSWQHLLHRQVAPRLRLALYTERGVVIATVPFHLRR